MIGLRHICNCLTVLLLSTFLLSCVDNRYEFEENYLKCFYASYPADLRDRFKDVEDLLVKHSILRDTTATSYMNLLVEFKEQRARPYVITEGLAADFELLKPLPASMQCQEEDSDFQKGLKESKFYQVIVAVDEVEKQSLPPQEFLAGRLGSIFDVKDFEQEFYRDMALMSVYGDINTEIRFNPQKYR